jgi:hypothetical protein
MRLRTVVILAVAIAGCSDAKPYGVVPVTGKIVYEDGSLIPAEDMILNFRSMEPPIDAKTHPRTGMTRVNGQDGTFDYVTTYAHADGAIRGRHKVSISVGANLVPQEFVSELTTPLVVSTDDAPFEFRIPKPERGAR